MKLLYLCLLLALLQACNSPAEMPQPSGGVKMQIVALNEFGQEVGAVGVSINLEGSGLNFAARTDASGQAELQGVPPGNYLLTCTRPDLSMYRKFGTRIVSQNTTELGQIKMVQPATTVAAEIAAAMAPDDNFEMVAITGSINPPGTFAQRREVRVFFGKSPSVSPTNYTASVSVINITSSQYVLYILVNDFVRRGFARGDLVYLVGYGSSRVGDSYTNYDGVQLFTGLNPLASNVATVRLPR